MSYLQDIREDMVLTVRFILLQNLIVLSAQFRPFRKFILTARGIQVLLEPEVVLLVLLLLRIQFRRLGGEQVVQRP